MSALELFLLALCLMLLGSIVILFAILRQYVEDRNAWRRTAFRASQVARNKDQDVDLAQRVARDLAQRGFK